jgi:hypothetical protein
MGMAVRCWTPGCDGLLRSDLFASRIGEPPILQDHTGYYIKCPECGTPHYPPQALCCPNEDYAGAS